METSLWYFRARYYSDELGRFISRDPLGYVDGMSLYAGYFAAGFGLDPMGQEFVPTGSDKFKKQVQEGINKIEKALETAKKKAQTDKEKKETEDAKEKFEKCKNSKKKITIRELKKSGNHYNDFTDTIYWNPNKKDGGKDIDGNTKRDPSVGLGHEISHAYDDVISEQTRKQMKSKSSDMSKYPNKTEENAVKFENQIRKGLNEKQRPKY